MKLNEPFPSASAPMHLPAPHVQLARDLFALHADIGLDDESACGDGATFAVSEAMAANCSARRKCIPAIIRISR